jgi:predicted TIM-barrel fold metal-dependent hydrolase
VIIIKIIDAHMHFSDILSFKGTALEISDLDYSSIGLKNEYEENNIIAGIGMGLSETEEGKFPDYNSLNPMRLDLEVPNPAFIYECLGINPYDLQTRKESIYDIENAISETRIVGFKIYAGYYPFYVYDTVYEPIYELAEKYNLPVVIHSGDTYSERGLIKYSHPIHIDELAVFHRNINFVIAHLGDPWVMDTAEILSKNRNVFADLSGLIVSDEFKAKTYINEKTFIDHFRRAIFYSETYDKLLFGTDWPLVQVKTYIEFIKKLVPEKYYEDIFYNNSNNLFKIFEEGE